MFPTRLYVVARRPRLARWHEVGERLVRRDDVPVAEDEDRVRVDADGLEAVDAASVERLDDERQHARRLRDLRSAPERDDRQPALDGDAMPGRDLGEQRGEEALLAEDRGRARALEDLEDLPSGERRE